MPANILYNNIVMKMKVIFLSKYHLNILQKWDSSKFGQPGLFYSSKAAVMRKGKGKS